jgi:sugar phosphate isomerase/epimerase
MNLTRRTLLKGAAAGLAGGVLLAPGRTQGAAAALPVKIKIGSCVVGLEEAKRAGLDGVEIGVGGPADTLQVADPAVREKYKEQMHQTGLVISSFMMGLLNSNPLASDPRGPAWLAQSIDAAKDLGAKVILVAFFGKGSLLDGKAVKKADVDVVVQRLKAAAPRARDAGVILGIENMLSAQQNAEILDRIGSDAVRIYYDVGNLTGMGYDVPAEIRFLKKRIAQFHFKDGRNYLGEGKVQYKQIAEAMREIGYQGWVVMETSNPSGDRVADARRNAGFIRKLFGMG